MGINKEAWLADIMETLFQGNEFVKMSMNDSEYINNEQVHVPQAGSAAAVTKNPSSFPIAVAQRTDTVESYTVNEYFIGPILIRGAEYQFVSYDKRQSILREFTDALNEDIGTECLHSWSTATSTRLVRTTGATGGPVPSGATGARKKVTLADIADLREIFDMDNVPNDGRANLLLPTGMFYDLMEIATVISRDYVERTSLPSGIIRTQIHGFNIMQRPTVVGFSNDTTPALKNVGAAFATTDNLGALAWHPNYVAHALGGIMPFANENDATYGGDVLSANVYFGSKYRRTDLKGIAMLIQKNA